MSQYLMNPETSGCPGKRVNTKSIASPSIVKQSLYFHWQHHLMWLLIQNGLSQYFLEWCARQSLLMKLWLKMPVLPPDLLPGKINGQKLNTCLYFRWLNVARNADFAYIFWLLVWGYDFGLSAGSCSRYTINKIVWYHCGRYQSIDKDGRHF